MFMVIFTIVLVIALLVCVWQLRSLSVQLADAQRKDMMKTAFIRNACHEIRTPLHVVSGLAEVVANDQLYLSRSEKQTISAQIKHNANLVATLLNELVFFSDRNKSNEAKAEHISPNFLCRRCVEGFKSQQTNEQVQLTFKRELGDEFNLLADPRMLELILNKLIINACRYTQQGEVTVGCNTSDNPGKLTVYVQDTGVGIPQNRRDELFNWFESPADNREEVELDLSIAQKLAIRMGGIIRIDPLYNKGTRVMLILPIR